MYVPFVEGSVLLKRRRRGLGSPVWRLIENLRPLNILEEGAWRSLGGVWDGGGLVCVLKQSTKREERFVDKVFTRRWTWRRKEEGKENGKRRSCFYLFRGHHLRKDAAACMSCPSVSSREGRGPASKKKKLYVLPLCNRTKSLVKLTDPLALALSNAADCLLFN